MAERHHAVLKDWRRASSNFPSGEYGKAPRPCVVCITLVDEADG